MQNSLKNTFTIAIFVFSALFSTTSFAAFKDLSFTPYGGVGVGMQHFGFKPGYGDNLFKKTLPKGNIFAGVKFCDYFGIEGGYETTLEKKRDVSLTAGDMNLGIAVPNGVQSVNYSNKAKIAGLYASLVGEYRFYSTESYGLSLIGDAGIKRTNVKLIRNRSSVNGAPSGSSDILNNNYRKTLLRVNDGLQGSIYEHFAIRALIGWENTSKLKPCGYSSTGSLIAAQLKNSIHYSIGLIFK